MERTPGQLENAACNGDLAVMRTPGWGFHAFKRAMDVAAGLTGLILLGPAVLAAGLWIKLQDRGPMFYSQWRVGQDGWLFRIHKLRTMRTDAERTSGARFASSDDDRVLRGCRWMRKSHFDELPQMWNILLGHMSLVGPRPERPELLDWLRRSIPRIETRLQAAPGLTGLAQVRHGYTNDLAGARRKLAYDIRYLRNRSVFEELRIVLATVPKIWDRGAL